jgi:hypothetical protein
VAGLLYCPAPTDISPHTGKVTIVLCFVSNVTLFITWNKAGTFGTPQILQDTKSGLFKTRKTRIIPEKMEEYDP